MDLKLFKAAASGDTDFLRQTEAHKLDSEVTPQKNTVLHIAVKSKQKEFAEQVLGLCPSLLLKANINGDTPLHVVARMGRLELAELLINTAKTLPADVEGQEVNVLKELLRMVNLKKETALHDGARNGHLGVVKLLMEADLGLLDLVNYADQSPLSLALSGGFSNIALHILETSPSSPCGGTDGINALHVAVFHKNHGTMKRLMEMRPEMIKEKDISERTPLHYAAFYGDLEAVQLFLQCDNSAAYLSDKDEVSLLHVAAYKGHVDVVRELIKSCPYIWELLDQKGQTALHVAVIAGNEKMVKYILEVPELVGLINEPNKEGNTPLHLAAVYQKDTIASILGSDKRMDKHAMNNESLTASDIYYSRKPEVVKVIEGLIPAPVAHPKDPRLRKELEEMEKQKAAIDKKAESLVRLELWCGLGFLVVQTAGFMWLTFWKLSWDVMEPICFYVASTYFIAGYAFFLGTSKEPSFEGFFQIRFSTKQKRLMKNKNFNIGRYSELRRACSPHLSWFEQASSPTPLFDNGAQFGALHRLHEPSITLVECQE